MEYIYFKDPNGNFGDDLNGWLWPQIFGEENLNNNDAFLGIGSILFNNHKIITDLGERKKIVFGTGIRPIYEAFKYDNTWDVKFLRGPLSAYSFNNQFEYITDAAYALRFVESYDSLKNTEKKYEVSLMPYFRSVKYFDWKSICDKLGYHYISPLSENGVEHTLKEIAASKYLITEAMHGAILADVLRVPWNRYVLTTPVTEGAMVSEFKWMDWLYSVGLNDVTTTFIKFNRKTFLNNWLKKMSNNVLDVEFVIKHKIVEEILLKLDTINQFYLSTDENLSVINSRLFEKIEDLKKQLL
ncbi:polysaccharide pyruvyl transferase family protein [Flavobacterium sp. 2]|uniref:polysaccharide pyruvyl transferase family protein n=1 Tax=Flavobacterium sp. 2 TaxID=308053 RepID=UPI003CE8B6F1